MPESKPAVDLFQTFRERRLSVALVVDEFGGVTGLVTMANILDCIFGEAALNTRLASGAHIEDLGDGRFAVDGAMRVADFNRNTGANLSTELAETLGGLLLHLHGELPQPGTSVEVDRFTFGVAEVEDNRVRRVQFDRAAPEESAGQDA